MDKRGKVIFSVIMYLFLIGIFSLYFVLAAGGETKSYDSTTQTVTVKNGDTEISKITLNTPTIYSVIRGKDRLVAEFTIENYIQENKTKDEGETTNKPIGITGGLIGTLLSKGNITIVLIAVLGLVLIISTISRTIIKLKNR